METLKPVPCKSMQDVHEGVHAENKTAERGMYAEHMAALRACEMSSMLATTPTLFIEYQTVCKFDVSL